MSADLYLHVFSDGELSEKDFQFYFAETFGSRWGPPEDHLQWQEHQQLYSFDYYTDESREPADNRERRLAYERSRELILATPGIWLGGYSSLKAAITGDDTYMPRALDRIEQLLKERLPLITPALIDQLIHCYTSSAPQILAQGFSHIRQAKRKDRGGPARSPRLKYKLADSRQAREFMEQHLGKRAFTL